MEIIIPITLPAAIFKSRRQADLIRSGTSGCDLIWNQGGRAYVSYGGATNSHWRGQIIHASDDQLSKMAGEIKANVKLYYFDGVDLDIEHWWDYNFQDNLTFARQFATLIKKLRHSLDSDPATQGKAIFLTVGWDAAGIVEGIPDSGAGTGSMLPFFNDPAAMDAIAGINIMSYNIGIANFYSRLDLIDHLLATFANAGIPPQKLILGIQPYESEGSPATPLDAITALGHYIRHTEYGGLFLWGIGTAGLRQLSAWDYLHAMQESLK